MRFLLWSLVGACSSAPRVARPIVAQGAPIQSSERQLRRGGPQALCVQLAVDPCGNLDCPSCGHLAVSQLECNLKTAAAIVALAAASGTCEGAYCGKEKYPPECGNTQAMNECRNRCTSCAKARALCVE